VGVTRDAYFQGQNAGAQSLRNVELLVGLVVAVLVLGIAFYGYRLSAAMRRVDNEREQALVDLKNQKLALDCHSIVSISDVNGRIIYANDQLCELSGYSRDELIGRNHRLLKSGEHDDAFYREMWETIARGDTWRGEVRNRAKDGSLYWVDATIVPFKDDFGRITQYTAIRTEITALKEAEERNRYQAARLETATEGAHVGIWELDVKSGRVYWDDTMHDVYGTDPASTGPNGTHYELWCSVVHPDDIEQAEQVLKQAIKGRTPFDTRFRIVRPDNGDTRHIKASATIEKDDAGRAVRMIGVNFDITDSVTTAEQIERREEEIRGILDAIPAYVYYKDTNNTILRLNRAAAESIGLPAEQIENRKSEEFFPAEDAAAYLEDDREVISSQKPKLGIIERYSTNGHDPLVIKTDKIPLRNSEGTYDRLVAIATDITEQRDHEQRLRASEERYTLAVRGSRDGLWDWDLITDRVYYAPRWKQMLGLEDQVINDSPDEWISRIDQRDVGAFMMEFEQHLRGEEEVFEVELRMRHYDGQTIWMLCRGAVVRDETGRAIRVAGSLADIDEMKQVEDELRRTAEHDRLTGLPNRELFHSRLRDAIERSGRDPEFKFAILFFDFDRFKVINDSLGHNVGDALLIDIADQFRQILRANDTAARFGGDEFVVLLNDLKNYDEALLAGNRLLEAFAEPHHLGGHDVFSTASIGLVTNESRYEQAEDMIRDADAAMYQAKEAGKARIIVFDHLMHERAVDRLQLEADLRDALQNDEFHLVYQPIISLEAGELYGFEALLRWEHPERGLVSPADFIPIAEDTGLIVPIGEWVLRHACRQLYRWNTVDRPELPVTLNVNLSMRQVCHPTIVNVIRDAIESSGADPTLLKLEVTESTIIDDRHDTIPLFNQIKDLGIKFAMDDFGTGHSSLGNLHKLPVDVLKIDQTFIQSMSANRELAAVMHAIITLAHELGMQTVAEGIETAEQLVMLQSLDCNYGQGFYFRRPMRADAATRYLLGLGDAAESA
jgi:diguanylate cyclase (GGDEF)-like protein/PAS domain S-box-containing protein